MERAHLHQLDGLRALAVGLVCLEHWAPPGSALRGALPWGSMGVRLFFVLSGYLITGILLHARQGAEAASVRRSAPPPRTPWDAVLCRFLARRALRIAPAFLLAAGVYAALDVGASRALLPWSLTCTLNLRCAATGTWPAGIAHFWTLGVEEQFYLLWPALVLLAPRRRLRGLTLAAIAAAPLARLVTVAAGGNVVTAMTPPWSCLDTLGAGALLAVLEQEEGSRLLTFLRGPAALVGLPLAAAVWLAFRSGSIGEGPLVVLLDCGLALVCAPLVAGAARGFAGAPGAVLASAPLTGIGRISYGIYLWHVLPLHLSALSSRGIDPSTTPVTFAAGAATLTLALALASWLALERPLGALKAKVPYLTA